MKDNIASCQWQHSFLYSPLLLRSREAAGQLSYTSCFPASCLHFYQDPSVPQNQEFPSSKCFLLGACWKLKISLGTKIIKVPFPIGPYKLRLSQDRRKETKVRDNLRFLLSHVYRQGQLNSGQVKFLRIISYLRLGWRLLLFYTIIRDSGQLA